jgi:phage tail protein X
MPATYQTKQHDVLDDVVARYYGDTGSRIVETVLEANPGLADIGPVMPAGILIELPDRPTPPTPARKKLWD